MKPKTSQFKKPGSQGGALIRQAIKLLRGSGVQLPITSHILIATSGGSDSIALAHLLVHYGQRVTGSGAGDPNRTPITLLHINHGWRGEDSEKDARFVEGLAAKWGVGFREVRLKGQSPKDLKGESWEERAREARRKIFESAIAEGSTVVTAHHADDLAETVLWRLCTGTASTHGGGIAASHGGLLRPFLQVRKSQLRDYLQEEGQVWREDQTNFEGRFLRSRMREGQLGLIAQLETLFPRAVEHLTKAALEAQKKGKSRAGASSQDSLEPVHALLSSAGIKARRSHFEALRHKMDSMASANSKTWHLDLPGGWRLTHEKQPARKSRWILEDLSDKRQDRSRLTHQLTQTKSARPASRDQTSRKGRGNSSSK